MCPRINLGISQVATRYRQPAPRSRLQPALARVAGEAVAAAAAAGLGPVALARLAVHHTHAGGIAVEEKVERAIGAAVLPEFARRLGAAEIRLAEQAHHLGGAEPSEGRQDRALQGHRLYRRRGGYRRRALLHRRWRSTRAQPEQQCPKKNTGRATAFCRSSLAVACFGRIPRP